MVGVEFKGLIIVTRSLNCLIVTPVNDADYILRLPLVWLIGINLCFTKHRRRGRGGYNVIALSIQPTAALLDTNFQW
jgi:hypothetical protein